MYRGKNPTALTSQKMLLDALNELLKEKDFKDITVSELCQRSGVSRQTFYSLFGSKENMLLYQMEKSPAARHPSPEEQPVITLRDSCRIYSRFVVSNYDQLKMMVDNDLLSVLNEQFYRSLSSCRQSFVNVSQEEREYAALFMSAGLCMMTVEYIRQNKKPDAKELVRLSYKIMSGDIYKR